MSTSYTFYRKNLMKMKTAQAKTVAGLKEQHRQELEEQTDLLMQLKAEVEQQKDLVKTYKAELEELKKDKAYKAEVEELKEEVKNLQVEHAAKVAQLTAGHEEKLNVCQWEIHDLQTEAVLQMAALSLQHWIELQENQERPSNWTRQSVAMLQKRLKHQTAEASRAQRVALKTEKKLRDELEVLKKDLQQERSSATTFKRAYLAKTQQSSTLVTKEEARERRLRSKKAPRRQVESAMAAINTQERTAGTTQLGDTIDWSFITLRRPRPSQAAVQDADGRAIGRPQRAPREEAAPRWK